MLSIVESGENMGLSDEELAITMEEPHNRELKMLMELLKSGSSEEQRMLVQALLDFRTRS